VNPKVKIAVFGRRRDAEAKALQAALLALGAEAVLVDFLGFPRLNQSSQGYLDRQLSFDDMLQAGTIELGEFDLIALRTMCFDTFDEGQLTAGPLDEQAVQIGLFHRRQVAKLAFQQSLLARLGERVPIVNPAASFRFHRLKAYQHQLLLRHGLPTPAAIATSDLARARDFAARFDGKVVAKPLTSGAEVVMADEVFFASCSSSRPYIFQQYVKGRSLRAYLLGGRIVTMGQVHHDQRIVDWRERTQSMSPFEPPAELAAQMQRAVRLLELPYCGMDVEFDERTERYYLLDFNPSALFVGYGRLMGLNMAERIATYLLEVLKRGGDPWLGDAPTK